MRSEGKIVAVCRSDKKGTKKNNIIQGLLEIDYGLAGDAHSGCNTHRQVSLLSIESIDKMRELGLDIGPGDFAENITTKGLDLTSLSIGTRISIGEEVLLEVTQIGKECLDRCEIYYQSGDCIMPREGVFAKVIKGGSLKVGDSIKLKSE